jgi:hypothetical protein
LYQRLVTRAWKEAPLSHWGVAPVPALGTLLQKTFSRPAGESGA